MDELLQWRNEFPILEKTVYMVSHSLGAMPGRTRDRLKEYADTWASRGIRAWEEGWWDMAISVGDLIGKIIGAGPGEIAMHQNVSIAQSTVASCFDWSAKRNKVVMEDMNFTTNLYIYHALERLGARVVTVPSRDGISIPIDDLVNAIDEETLLVPISHVLFLSSYVQDLRRIIERAHAVGAMVMADIYQSAGTVPLNVRELSVDFATGGSVKWLCGGPGAGYLYVRADLAAKLEPKLTGWMAHRHPFDFEAGPIDYADNMFRFLNGSPNIPGLYAARSGYEIINEIGVGRIREKSIRQTTRLIELAREAGFGVNAPERSAERGGTVAINVPDGQAVTKELLRRDFLVDYRPRAGIRVAPHFYSKDEELDLIVAEIKKILGDRAPRHSSSVITN